MSEVSTVSQALPEIQSQRPGRSWLLPTVLAGSAVLAAVLAIIFAGSSWFIDLRVYQLGGRAWLADVRLYAPGFPSPLAAEPRLPFTYPPFAAILFSLLAVLPFQVTAIAVMVFGVAAVYATCFVTARTMGGDRSTTLLGACAIAAVTIGLEPVRATLSFGQINLLLLVLVAVDCLMRKPPWPRGLMIGIAAAIKLTPAAFLLYFLVAKQWRPIITAVVTFLACVLFAWLLAPADSLEYWTTTLFDPTRIGGLAYASNQSFRGLLHRLDLGAGTESAVWMGLVLVTVALTAAAAWRLRQRGEHLLALFVIAAAGLLASPASWSHHWVWIAPGLVMIGFQWWRTRSPWLGLTGLVLFVIFAVGPHWLLPREDDRELRWSIWQHLLGNSFVWVGVALIGWGLYRGFRTVPPAAQEPALPAGDAGLSEPVVERGGQ